MSLTRNAPCACGSAKRYKNCCGAISTQPQQPPSAVSSSHPYAASPLPAARSPQPPYVQAQPADTELALSLILPFYRKLAEFRLVLPLNLPYFARPGLEVIIVMDESSEEAELLQLIERHPQVRWRVIVNDQPHDWRPPCKAINVGIRHARGRYLFVASPESALVGDVLQFALEVVKDFPRGIAIGRVGFARFQDLQAWRLPLHECFERSVAKSEQLHAYYGSICGPRAAFEAINGYDESFTTWGSDDDNLRVRLEMAGYALLACPPMRVLHLAFEARNGGENPKFAYDPRMDRLRCSPEVIAANSPEDWGRDFARFASASGVPPPMPAGGLAALTLAESNFAPPPGSVVPTGSRRQCRACGRLIHYQAAPAPCAHCTPAALHWSRPRHAEPTGAASAAIHTRGGPPRIACVMQLRNEAFYLQGCLDHLRGYVDGVIALDDGSTDDTAAILRGESTLIADCLSNPPRGDAEHVWNELENRRRLLQRASELGFDWVLCCDADERYELALLKNLRTIAASFAPTDLVHLSVSLKELWNSPRQYRADGIWDGKTRARLFALPPKIVFVRERALHGQWYPEHLRKYGRGVEMRHHLYHLKMIHAADRRKRRDLYKRLDPENRFQPAGYDYLAEEGPELRLQTVPAGREYDFDTLPPALKAIL